jgi:hypothetical protein
LEDEDKYGRTESLELTVTYVRSLARIVERIGAYKSVTGKPDEKRSLLIPSPSNIMMDHQEIRYMELRGLD